MSQNPCDAQHYNRRCCLWVWVGPEVLAEGSSTLSDAFFFMPEGLRLLTTLPPPPLIKPVSDPTTVPNMLISMRQMKSTRQ